MSIMTTWPLVSIGLPTYNRPGGLKTALDHIISQSYTKLEIIVSDNHSDNEETILSIIEDYGDSRIQYIRQETNIGGILNFKFLVQKSSGEFFMWAADDDYLESDDIIEKLVKEIMLKAETSLVFPDFNFVDGKGNLNRNALHNPYSKCKSSHDYILGLCKSGVGNPVYGLYRKCIMTDELMALNYYDLSYFNEGVFIHYVFLNYGVMFVPGIYIRYFSSNVFEKISKSKIVKDFIRYSFRLIKLYLRSNLNFMIKCYCISFLLLKHSITTIRFLIK